MPTRPATIILHLDVDERVTEEDMEYARAAAVRSVGLELINRGVVVDAEQLFGALTDYRTTAR